jgi:hypothetical protein
MPVHLSTLASFTEVQARVLAKYQIDPARFFSDLGLAEAPYHDADARLRTPDVTRVWDAMVKATGNPCVGFEVGMGINPLLYCRGCLSAGILRSVDFARSFKRWTGQAPRDYRMALD